MRADQARQARPSAASGPGGAAAEPSEALLRKWVIGIAPIVAPLLVLGVYYKLMFPGLVNTQALDFAQLARNLSQGHGYVTYILRPLALGPQFETSALRQPDLNNAPLYPFLLALSFGALGATDKAVFVVSGSFFVLTVGMTYLLGSRAFNSTVGVLAAAAALINAPLLEYAISGLHITLILFLTTCLIYSFLQLVRYGRDATPETRLPRLALVLIGLCTAGLYLTDYAFVVLVPVTYVLMLTVVPAHRLQATAWLTLPLALLTLPWMARNALLTGNPLLALRGYEVWMNTSPFPAYTGYQYLASDLSPSPELLKGLIKKCLMGIAQLIQGLPSISGNWFLAFFLPGLLFQFADPAANALRRVTVTCFVAVTLSFILLGLRAPLLVGAVPALLVFSVAFMMHLAQQARLQKPSVVLVGTLLSMAMLFPLLYDTALIPRPRPLPEAATAALLAGRSGQGDVVLTDQPHVVAWYGHRPALWVPLSDANTGTLKERLKVRWLFLTDAIRNVSPSWQTVYDQFLRWNLADQGLRRQIEVRRQQGLPAEGQPPPALTITAGPGDGTRQQGGAALLFEVLEGFTTVSVGTSVPPNTVVAVLKKHSSTHQVAPRSL